MNELEIEELKEMASCIPTIKTESGGEIYAYTNPLNICKTLYNTGYRKVENYNKEIERLKEENKQLKQILEGERTLKTTQEDSTCDVFAIIRKIKREAFKEFAEKLKNRAPYIEGYTVISVGGNNKIQFDFNLNDFIDDVLKDYGIKKE